MSEVKLIRFSFSVPKSLLGHKLDNLRPRQQQHLVRRLIPHNRYPITLRRKHANEKLPIIGLKIKDQRLAASS